MIEKNRGVLARLGFPGKFATIQLGTRFDFSKEMSRLTTPLAKSVFTPSRTRTYEGGPSVIN